MQRQEIFFCFQELLNTFLSSYRTPNDWSPQAIKHTTSLRQTGLYAKKKLLYLSTNLKVIDDWISA